MSLREWCEQQDWWAAVWALMQLGHRVIIHTRAQPPGGETRLEDEGTSSVLMFEECHGIRHWHIVFSAPESIDAELNYQMIARAFAGFGHPVPQG